MKIKEISVIGLFMGVVIIVTMFLAFPVTGLGYINLGDTVIMVAAYFFNPIAMLYIAGIGSSLADLLAGYGQYAFFTLVIKSLEGAMISYMIHRFKFRFLDACLIGVLNMILGYALVEVFFANSFSVFIPAFGLNLVQGSVSLLLAFGIVNVVKKRWRGIVNETGKHS